MAEERPIEESPPTEDALVRQETEDARVREETEAAGREAAAIGGKGSNEDIDPAEQPLAEAGQGVAEGFEEAERELVEHASHGDQGPDPTHLAGEPEPERSGATYGEADHVESTERPEPEEGRAGA